MIGLVCFAVVSFLKHLIGPYAGFFHYAKPFDVEWGGVNIYPADFAVAFFYAVCDFHGLGNKFRAVLRVFAVNKNQSLLSVIFQYFYFFYQLFVRERFTNGILVRSLKSAVSTVIGALISHVKRCEEHDAVPVNSFLKFPGTLFNELYRPRIGSIDKYGHFFEIQPVFCQ